MGTTETTVKKEEQASQPTLIKNRIVLVLDDSGSMSHIARPAEAAFNRTIDDIIEKAKSSDQNTKVTVYKFGTSIDLISDFNCEINKITHVRGYNPRQGSTRLFDATGKAIEDMLEIERRDGADCSFLLIVVTDGQENDSQVYGNQRDPKPLKDLMNKVQAMDRYTLTFLLPVGAKQHFCRQFEISEGNVAEWETSVRGLERSTVMRSQGLSGFFAARATGQKSVKNFYVTTDASKVTSADLKNMDNIARQVRVWTVDKECEIRPFCVENLNGSAGTVPYEKGAAYYQLTKPETIQSYKKILIMEKGKKAVYHGDQARALIGIPVGVESKVAPGNHANYDIFVQSTSVNRKLVRGTRVVYWQS